MWSLFESTAHSICDTEKPQRRYEAYARMRARMNNTKPFRVYGIPGLFPLDLLRYCILTSNHHNRHTPFPPGYVSISDGVECSNTALLGLDLREGYYTLHSSAAEAFEEAHLSDRRRKADQPSSSRPKAGHVVNRVKKPWENRQQYLEIVPNANGSPMSNRHSRSPYEHTSSPKSFVCLGPRCCRQPRREWP